MLRPGIYNNAAVAVPAFVPVDFSVTHMGHDDSADSVLSYTFSNKSLGPAHVRRKIVVAVYIGGTAGTVITSVTVGGYEAQVLIDDPSGTRTLEMWVAQVPTGTTGDIVVTHTVTSSMRCAVDWWSILGTNQDAPYSKSGTGSASAPTATLINIPSVTVPTGGYAMAVVASSVTAPQTITQDVGTGTTRTNSDLIGSVGSFSSYDTTQVGPVAISATTTVAGNLRGCAITWGP